MLSPGPDRAHQCRQDQEERCTSILRDCVRHLEAAGIDKATITHAVRRLTEDRGHA
jgi:hypothetical protein